MLKKVSDKEFEHVLHVCNKFEMKRMRDHHGLQLNCDVLLLAEVIEKFKKNSLRNVGLCPSHYFSAPCLS